MGEEQVEDVEKFGKMELEATWGTKILIFSCDSQTSSPDQLQMGGKLEAQKSR